MIENEGFGNWFKANTPKEGLSENTTFTKQFLIDAWNNGYNKAKEEMQAQIEIMKKDYELLLDEKFRLEDTISELRECY